MAGEAFRIEGTDDFQKVADVLKEVDSKELTNATRKAMREVLKPVSQRIVERGSEQMPHRGGLADHVRSGAKVGALFGIKSKVANVKIVLRNKGVGLAPLDKGKARHPLFGLKRHWFLQEVPEGAFTKGFTEAAPLVRAELLKAANEVIDKAARVSS